MRGGRAGADYLLSLTLDTLWVAEEVDATPILPLSRLGADAEFQKLDAAISFTQPLPESFVLGIYAAELQRQSNEKAARASTVAALKAVGLSMLVELVGASLAGLVWFVAAIAS